MALLLVPLVAGSCYSWRPAELEPRALVESEHPGRMRVTSQDSTRYVLDEPRIVADSLVGRHGQDSVAVALPDVARVELYRFSPGQTAAALLISLGIAVWYSQCVLNGQPGCGRSN